MLLFMLLAKSYQPLLMLLCWQGRQIDMQDRLECLFQVDAAALQVLAALALDGQTASSYTSIHATGITIVGQSQGQALLHCGQDNLSGLDYQVVQRYAACSVHSRTCPETNMYPTSRYKRRWL